MNQLFVAKYTSSRNGVKADVIILLQSIEGDLGVLTHRILLAKCLGLVPQTTDSKLSKAGYCNEVPEQKR